MTEELDRRYMAGFFDGEGCVNITVSGRARQVVLRVMITNTDPIILEKIQRTFGGRLTKPRVLEKGWKAFRQIVLIHDDAKRFLLSIYPFLVVKKAQAKLAIEFRDFQERPKRERCVQMPTPSKNFPNKTCLKRSSETLAKELGFKEQMHLLNKKGAVEV